MTKRSSALLLAAAVTGILLLLTVVVAWQHGKAERYVQDLEFAREASCVVHRLREWGQHYETLLHAARTLVAVSDTVTPQAWKRFADRQDLAALYAGVKGLVFLPVQPGQTPLMLRVSVSEVGQFVSFAALSHDGAGVGAGETALPEVARRARDNALSVLASPADFGVGNIDAGNLLYIAAAYDADTPIESVAQRRASFHGFVGLVIDSETWFDAAVLGIPARFAVRIGDEGGEGNPKLRFERGQWPQEPPRTHEDWLTLGGRVIHVAMAPSFSVADGPFNVGAAAWILGGGWTVSLLIGFVVWLIALHRHRAMDMAAEMTGALLESEERYRKLFTANRAVELLIDPLDGRIVDANEAASRFYGWPGDTLRGMRIQDINTLAPEQVAEEMRRAKNEHRDHFFFQHRCADGTVRDVEVHSGPLEVEGRQLLYSIIHDITDRKRAERGLVASEARFRTLFEQSPLPIQVLSKDGRILRVNRAWERLCGRSGREVVAAAENVFDDPQLVEAGVSARLRASLTGVAVEVEDFPYAPSGAGEEPRWLNTYAYPSHDEEGQFSEIIVIYRDVSDRRAQELALVHAMRELERSNADLEQFAYVASHDLQEPLRMVSGYMNVLDKRYGAQLGDEARQFIGFARDGAQRMECLIRDLLTYSRVERSGRAMTLVPAEDALVIALADLRIAIEEAGAKVSHEPLPTVRADKAQLVRLFENLISNALKYRRPDATPTIQITVERRGAAPETGQAAVWLFRVTDNGIGIAPEAHERVFGIFQRLHTAEEVPGTGVGLALCKKIVERHGGHIGVESEQGRGATFWFTMPVPSA